MNIDSATNLFRNMIIKASFCDSRINAIQCTLTVSGTTAGHRDVGRTGDILGTTAGSRAGGRARGSLTRRSFIGSFQPLPSFERLLTPA
jgi:hypothetical protein